MKYTTLHYTTQHCTSLHYTTLPYTTLHYPTLHYTILHYTTLHYTTLGLHGPTNMESVRIERKINSGSFYPLGSGGGEGAREV